MMSFDTFCLALRVWQSPLWCPPHFPENPKRTVQLHVCTVAAIPVSDPLCPWPAVTAHHAVLHMDEHEKEVEVRKEK